MNALTVRGLVLGEGIPKICVSITEASKDAIGKQTKVIMQSSVELVEWRVDFFDFDCPEEVIEFLPILRDLLGELPLIFTFRNLEEGGQKSLSPLQYTQLLKRAMETKCVDIIDIEVFKSGLSGDMLLHELLSFARNHKVITLASYHDFEGTPSEENLMARLEHMEDLGVELAKIAVMPKSEQDVQILLSVGKKYTAEDGHLPIVAISMGELGKITRIGDQSFSPAFTFGALGKSSAPGQIHVDELRNFLFKQNYSS